MLPTFGEDPGSIQYHIMIKILFFGRSCKHYLRRFKDRGPEVTFSCDGCGRILHKHGRYFRYVACKTQVIQIPIYRWLCPNCRRTISLLPDFLVPWARYTTWIREAAIVRKRRGCSWRTIAENLIHPVISVSTTTVKRWWKKYVHKTQAAALWLARELILAGEDEDLLRKHASPVNASKHDTMDWFEQLQKRYTSEETRIRGYWSYLNARFSDPIWL